MSILDENLPKDHDLATSWPSLLRETRAAVNVLGELPDSAGSAYKCKVSATRDPETGNWTLSGQDIPPIE